ncbi:MAG: 4Fe-4S binding protein [Candidatus Marinimicrobia bacterium]|nr:4Fe-4S binding protein [Candidatus Neomarinimicrobiota bacterium]
MQDYFKNIIEGVKSLVIGMRASLKHFNNRKELVATLQYPHEKWPIPERNIGYKEENYNLIRSRLHVDIDDCIGCLQCERACPVDCIKIETVKPPKGSDHDCGITSNDTQKKMLVSRFSIDMAECCYCNLCAYPCPEECIYMVGGPNSNKHEIDYEFAKYERDGLMYEFATASDEEIGAVGGEKYLEKKKARAEELDNALELVAMAAEKAQQDIDKGVEKSPEKKSDTPVLPKFNFASLNDIEDKPTRGLAKRAFVRGHRLEKDSQTVAGMIKTDLEKAGKYSSDFDGILKLVGEAPLIILPEGAEEKKEVVSEKIETVEEIKSETKPKADAVPDIKILNDITDKMVRGIAKKAFMSAKRQKLDPQGYVEAIKSAMSEADKSVDDISEILNTLVPQNTKDSLGKVETKTEKSVTVIVPDIKILNDISDKMARGTAKKAFMSAKREKLDVGGYLNKIEGALKEADLLSDENLEIIKKLAN